MNRITQCLHGRGTVSAIGRHRDRSRPVPAGYLAFAGMYRPVVFWNVTDRCNLRCSHCYNAREDGSGAGRELATQEAEAVVDDLAGMGVPLIIFSGGEPLMREDLFGLARYAADRGIMTALSTNGTLITPDVAKRIRNAGIGYAGISLDGARAGTHDRFRGAPGSFDRAVSAFAACREAGLRSGVRVTLTRQNYPELEDLVDLAHDLGACRFCLYWLVPAGRGSGAYDRLQLGPAEVTGALSLLYRKAQEIDPGEMEFLTVDAPQDCIHLIGAMEREGSADLDDARQLLDALKGGCSAGTRVANIDAAGNVYPCQFARSPEFAVGNIRDVPFSRLWDDPENPALALFRQEEPRFGGKCGECRHRELCGGGCRVRAHAGAGDVLAGDPFCYCRDA